ncbi:G kinase-anchoring protein 1-like isoform X2 [Euwallacea fornicatus]|uniref:G kinase-anchoring protein 1-like isoform X2 n=1 Tax=Euwallacea fornicatus TaxID=995702 RepID=UPI00338ED62D
MDIAVPSRFACLKIEDDEFRPASSNSKKKTDGKSNKKVSSSAKDLPKSTTGANRKGAHSSSHEKSKTEVKRAKKAKEGQEKEWEEWQKKDAKFVNEAFEEQMQNAILQSKLEFERQKKNLVIKTDIESTQGKKKKGRTMGLDEFLDIKSELDHREETKVKIEEKDFFQEVFETTKKAITKDNVEQSRKKRQEAFKEVVSLAQCQEKLEAERAKNTALEKELEEARKEISVVKKRNQTLCSMLSQGEMKDKAEVLVELERLTGVKEELTEEVGNLHKLLEQERSNKGSLHGNQTDNHSKHSKEKTKKKKH